LRYENKMEGHQLTFSQRSRYTSQIKFKFTRNGQEAIGNRQTNEVLAKSKPCTQHDKMEGPLLARPPVR